MVLITIVTGAYKPPTNITGGPHIVVQYGIIHDSTGNSPVYRLREFRRTLQASAAQQGTIHLCFCGFTMDLKGIYRGCIGDVWGFNMFQTSMLITLSFFLGIYGVKTPGWLMASDCH